MTLHTKLAATVELLSVDKIPAARRILLQEIINYINQKRNKGDTVKLNFICTHNSRRSQLAQIWAQTAADYYKIDIHCFSGGVEITAFNVNALAAIERSGFTVSKEGEDNPTYRIKYSVKDPGITAFSKVYDDIVNPDEGFAAIMTCADADENCPFIPGAEVRIPLLYDDPKAFDNTPQAEAKYDERSKQIAAEMFYVFSEITV